MTDKQQVDPQDCCGPAPSDQPVLTGVRNCFRVAFECSVHLAVLRTGAVRERTVLRELITQECKSARAQERRQLSRGPVDIDPESQCSLPELRRCCARTSFASALETNRRPISRAPPLVGLYHQLPRSKPGERKVCVRALTTAVESGGDCARRSGCSVLCVNPHGAMACASGVQRPPLRNSWIGNVVIARGDGKATRVGGLCCFDPNADPLRGAHRIRSKRSHSAAPRQRRPPRWEFALLGSRAAGRR